MSDNIWIKQAEDAIKKLSGAVNADLFYVDPAVLEKMKKNREERERSIINSLKFIIKDGLEYFNEFEMIRLCTDAVEEVKEEIATEKDEDDEDCEYDCCEECG